MDLAKLREKNLQITKQKLKESIHEDNLIIQSINNYEELNKILNTLVKRLREWYELYNPEFSKETYDNESFVKYLKKEKSEMGGNLKKEDVDIIFELKEKIKELYDLEHTEEKYLDSLMDSSCKNLKTVAGTLIGARLIGKAGSLKKLALMPASTIQLLGAEKALFRHIKTKAKCPRHGLIHEHPFILQSKNQFRGKIARQFADKISLAVKIDYFKGEFKGDKLKKEMEDNIRKIKG